MGFRLHPLLFQMVRHSLTIHSLGSLIFQMSHLVVRMNHFVHHLGFAGRFARHLYFVVDHLFRRLVVLAQIVALLVVQLKPYWQGHLVNRVVNLKTADSSRWPRHTFVNGLRHWLYCIGFGHLDGYSKYLQLFGNRPII